MTTAIHTRKARAAAATLACVLALVGLAACYAALSVTLTSAEHACCHTENINLPCLTLCAASQSDAVLAAEADASPDATAVVLAADSQIVQPARPRVRVDRHSKPGSSPPLYLRHAALLL